MSAPRRIALAVTLLFTSQALVAQQNPADFSLEEVSLAKGEGPFPVLPVSRAPLTEK